MGAVSERCCTVKEVYAVGPRLGGNCTVTVSAWCVGFDDDVLRGVVVESSVLMEYADRGAESMEDDLIAEMLMPRWKENG